MPVSTVPNSVIGLRQPGSAGEIQLPITVYKYIASQKEAPIPQRTVGKAQNLRERILVASLFPDIYTRSKK